MTRKAQTLIRYIALLRAVNVGGTGKLPMKDLVSICEAAGFLNVRTYIASGNVIFSSHLPEKGAREALERGLLKYSGKPVGVLVRTGLEMRNVLEGNPFPDAPGNRAVAIFLSEPPTPDAIEAATGRKGEVIVLGPREIYVRYDNGMADSKLRIPAAKNGTSRNMNTVAKLVALSRGD